MRRKLLLATVVLIPLICFVQVLVFNGRIRNDRVKARLPLVKLGMTREQVQDTVGKPRRIKKMPDGAELWIFPHGRSESEVPRCTFGSNGTVVEVVIDDAQRIAPP